MNSWDWNNSKRCCCGECCVCLACKDGLTPFIGANGNWWIGETDTGVPAKGTGTAGKDGDTPFINDLGNWQIGIRDTGIKARGDDGPQGPAGPKGPQGDQGIQGPQGIQGVQGENGQDGTSLHVLGSFETYEEFIAAHPTGNAGDAWFADGYLYVWNESANQWDNVGYLRGPQGVQGEQGIQGLQGPQGVEGPQGPKGDTGPAGPTGLVPKVYHADLSKVGNQIEIWLDGIRAQWIYNTSTSISFNIYSGSGTNVTVDLKRSSQYDGTASEGSTLDNYTLTSAYQAVDTIVYNSSREMHRTWIRTKNPTTGLWNLYQIDLCVSNSGARTDIIVWTIYENIVAPW